MSRSARRAIALCALLGALACAGDRITQRQMAPRLAYQGFSFERPASPAWYILRAEETHPAVTLRREVPGDTHSFFARVQLAALERQPRSHADFARLAEVPDQTAPYPTKTLSKQQEQTTRQGQWCIRFDSRSLSTGAPVAPEAELTLLVRGYRCLHPAFPKTVLEFYYSERGREDELDPALTREGEAFLEGVRIDVAPGTPAG